MFPQTFDNGHGADTLRAKGRAFISRRIFVRHSASFDNTLCDSYRQYRSAHDQGNALASHTSPTTILLWLFFYFYGLPPLIPSILTFLRRACSVWEYNTTKQQGWTSTVCGEYCCLFALYVDLGTHLNSLWASSMPPPPTARSAAYSHRS
jgi:hypothetical protein